MPDNSLPKLPQVIQQTDYEIAIKRPTLHALHEGVAGVANEASVLVQEVERLHPDFALLTF